MLFIGEDSNMKTNNDEQGFDQLEEKTKKREEKEESLKHRSSIDMCESTPSSTHKKLKTNKNGEKTGRWTKAEHERFLEAIQLYGRDWKKVQQHVGTRSSTQSRSHAQKYFKKIGIDCLSKDASDLRAQLEGQSVTSTKRRKVTEDDDEEEPIIITIEFCDTPNPRLRKAPEVVKEEELPAESNQDEQKAKSEDLSDPFQIPDPSSSISKSRSDSEKSLSNAKNLSMCKLPSVVSLTTQCTPSAKAHLAASIPNLKAGRSFDLTNASLHNNEAFEHHEDDFNMKTKCFDFIPDIEKINEPVDEVPLKVSLPLAKQEEQKIPAFEPSHHFSLEASEHLDDNFSRAGDFKDNLDGYHDDEHLRYDEDVHAKADFGFGHPEIIESVHSNHPHEPISKFGNMSIDEFGQNKEQSYHIYADFANFGLLNESHHDEFNYADCLP